jgi:hypothetical protein
MENAPHKIHVRLGDAEFTAEGNESTVQAQYEAFLKVLDRIGSSPAKPKVSPSDPDKKVGQLGAPDKATFARVYSDDPQKGVSLKALPKGDKVNADALLLILYGYHVLRQVDTVTAIQLGRSAKQSGFEFDRADRIFESAGYDKLVSKSGQRAGSKYSLMNPGLVKAGELVGTVLG